MKDILYYNNRLYVPEEESLQSELLRIYHDDIITEHFGIKKIIKLLMRKYFWKNMIDDVKEYIRTCDICQRVKVPRHRPYGKMQTLRQPTSPWKEVTIDFITDLPPSKQKGNIYDSILIVIDCFIKMARYIPTTKTIDAIGLTNLFIDEVAIQYEMPAGIILDRGSVFMSNYWSEICYDFNIKRQLNTAFHLQTDRQTECQNQTLEHYLRVYCSDDQSNWAMLLPLAEYVYNNASHSSTGCSPFYAMYGYNPDFYINAEDSSPEEGGPAISERVPAAKEQVK